MAAVPVPPPTTPGSFPGMGGSARPPLPSADPTLPADLISPHMIDQVKQMLSSQQMQQLMSNKTQAQFEKVVQAMLAGMVSTSLTAISKKPGGQTYVNMLADITRTAGGATQGISVPTGGQPSGLQSTTAAGSLSAQPAPIRTASPVAQEDQAPQERVTFGQVKQRFQEGRSANLGDSAGQMLNRAGGGIAKWASNYQSDWEPDMGADGKTPNGNWVKKDDQDKIIDQVAPGDSRYRGVAYKARIVGSVASKVGGLVGEEGGLARLGAIGGRFAGPIGMTVTAGLAAGHFMEKQQQDATFYRSAFGEQGTGSFAASDRIGEFVAGLKGFGTIGSARAKDQYRQASSLGLRGGARDDASQFSTDMYKKFGMETSDSMAIVSTAIEQGNISLTKFADAIGQVSKVAVAGGKASTAAIQDFLATQQYVAQNITQGNGSVGIAANLSTITAGMSRQTSNAIGGGTGLAQTLGSRGALYRAAMASGQNPLEAEYNLHAGGATSTNEFAKLLQGGATMTIQRVAAILGVTPDQMRADTQRVAMMGQVTDLDQQGLWLKWSRGDKATAEMNYRLLAGILTQAGYKVSDSDPMPNLRILFSMLTDKMKNTTKGGVNGTGLKKAQVIGGYTGDEKHDEQKFAQDIGQGADYAAKAAGGNYQRVASGADRFHAQVGSSAAFQAYMNLTKATHKGDTAITALLSAKGRKALSDYSGESDLDKQKFIVRLGGNKTKTVSMAEVISNKDYRAQLESGQLGAQGKGKNDVEAISAITGVGSGSAATAGGGGGGGSSKVLFDLTPAAKGLLKQVGPTKQERAAMPGVGRMDPSTVPHYGGN